MKVTAIMVLLVGCILLMCADATAQSPAPAPPQAIAAGPTPTASPTTAYTLSPDKLAKAKALYDLRIKLLVIGTATGFVVLLAVLYFGLMARYRDWAERAAASSQALRVFAFIFGVGAISLCVLASLALFPKETLVERSVHGVLLLGAVWWIFRMITRRKWTELMAQAIIAVPLLLLTTRLLHLPLDVYRHGVNLRYGLSVQGWGSWLGDLLKGELISLIFATLLLCLMIYIIRKSPRWWWFYFWLILLPVFMGAVVGGPLVIDPMFNKFEPLQKTSPELVTAIEKVTERGGLSIPPERMFLMKASEKTTELNAYVTGLGPSKRVVVWDTTIQKTSTPETLFVFGHEMGHYVLNHVVIGLAVGAIGLLIGLYLLYILSGWFLRRFGQRWRIRNMGDWAVLPMIFLIFGILGFFATPLGSAFSRQLEHNADIYGLEVTHGINANSQEAGAHAFQVLGELSLSYPYPNRLLVFWYSDHPPIPDRVRFAHEYDPWSKGEPPKYVK